MHNQVWRKNMAAFGRGLHAGRQGAVDALRCGMDEQARYRAAAWQAEEQALGGGLYIVSTPLGHARDISLRALDVLAAVDVIYCEDTRNSSKLLAHHAIQTPTAAYHEHNGAKARPKILAALADGKAVALISDAGTPLISDPGMKLVREARAAGHAVTAIPGASARSRLCRFPAYPATASPLPVFCRPKARHDKARLKI